MAEAQVAVQVDVASVATKRQSSAACALFREMKNDLARRRPHYLSDWKDGWTPKVVSSSLFMFFTSIAPAITFSAVLDDFTKKDSISQLGPAEVLFSTALTGCIFAIFGGQPLCIVGVTGPVTIFTMACYTLSEAWDVPFLPFYCWVQIWSALMHMVLAITNACAAISLVSRFSCETFGMLIATIYIVTGAQHLIGYFDDKQQAPALLSLLLGLGTAWLALTLAGARGWSIFSRAARATIADYAATAAALIFCIVPYLCASDLTPHGADGRPANFTLATLEVRSTFAPTKTGRSWLINPGDCPTPFVFAAIGPAFFLTVLFFFDHNVSSLLCQAPEFGLRKGSAYHWDFFVVGVQILVTGLLGIPPVNGLIPQAPLHTDSLCEKAFRANKVTGVREEIVVKCHEQRVSNLAQALLIGCVLPAIRVVGYLPIPVLDGLFLYMGIASFAGNTCYERALLFFTDKQRRDARKLPYTGADKSLVGRVPMRIIRRFTIVQLTILAAIFVVTRLPFVDGFFPVLIAVLVPLRIYVLPKVFGAEYVDALDFQSSSADADGSDDADGTDGTSGVAVISTTAKDAVQAPSTPATQAALSQS